MHSILYVNIYIFIVAEHEVQCIKAMPQVSSATGLLVCLAQIVVGAFLFDFSFFFFLNNPVSFATLNHC